jgi:hypothetical protein
MFWDEKKVYFIQEPAIRVVSLIQVGGESTLAQTASLIYSQEKLDEQDLLKDFKWQQPRVRESKSFEGLNTIQTDDRDGLHERIMLMDL